MLAVRGDKCLLGRQAAWPKGFWSCLAGFVEPGETLEQAAAREILEEAGVRCTTSADYLFCQPWPFPSSLMVGLILEADGEDITVDTSELETARWFTREETASMMAGTNPEAFAPPRFAIAHHVIKAWLDRGSEDKQRHFIRQRIDHLRQPRIVETLAIGLGVDPPQPLLQHHHRDAVHVGMDHRRRQHRRWSAERLQR